MTKYFQHPIHLPRPMPRRLTAAERLGLAQRCSLHSRPETVTLPTPPWAEEEETDT